ncbi:F-box domain-containing protein [Histoplasma capsulatum]|uniref:F-box domain-containing protein n=1 Tax=Ajellomyces capsulatus TaxID=5037 RepID=A0A8A1LXZ6_AJECA|nr:F-box domain-containing protein [Histoplasma capsulatum]
MDGPTSVRIKLQLLSPQHLHLALISIAVNPAANKLLPTSTKLPQSSIFSWSGTSLGLSQRHIPTISQLYLVAVHIISLLRDLRFTPSCPIIDIGTTRTGTPLRHFRSKGKSKSVDHYGYEQHEKYNNRNYNRQNPQYSSYRSGPSRDFTQNLPLEVLSRIFSYVCLHVLDDTYNSSEESMTEDGCMLCDMRDLAHCALVCRKWYSPAHKLLYQNVRIDAVHYCDLEYELSAKRKKNSFLDHNSVPLDAPMTRLTLFSRTVRESQRIGKLVFSLRMPYMTREAGKLLLAQTVLMLPNLRYVDLPAGVFCDDESTMILKQTLIARCPDIRRMKYSRGSEKTFSAVQQEDEIDAVDQFMQGRQLHQPARPQIKVWQNLEVLELCGLSSSIDILRRVLVQFPRLTDLKLEDLNEIEPVLFKNSPSLSPFPPIERLTLNNTPGVTDRTFMDYFSTNRNKRALKHLTLSNTGITPGALHHILNNSPKIHSLSVTQYISEGFVQDNVPLLASHALCLLHYEITARTEHHAAYYYKYLMSSLLSGSLPSLVDLYVRDAKFPEMLMYASLPQLGGSRGGASGSPAGLNQALSVYSKGAKEAEWNFTAYEPLDVPGAGVGGRRRGSSSRPVSFHGAQLSPAWGDEARRSVLVGNGVGGFLAIPGEEERPKSSGGAWMRHHHRREGSKGDLWR